MRNFEDSAPTTQLPSQQFVEDVIRKVLRTPKAEFKLDAVRSTEIFRGYHELFKDTQYRPEFIVFGQDVLDALLHSPAIKEKDFTFFQTYMQRDTKQVTLFGMVVLCDWNRSERLIPDNTIAFVAIKQNDYLILRTSFHLPV